MTIHALACIRIWICSTAASAQTWRRR